jgi:hypothetical protein
VGEGFIPNVEEMLKVNPDVVIQWAVRTEAGIPSLLFYGQDGKINPPVALLRNRILALRSAASRSIFSSSH